MLDGKIPNENLAKKERLVFQSRVLEELAELMGRDNFDNDPDFAIGASDVFRGLFQAYGYAGGVENFSESDKENTPEKWYAQQIRYTLLQRKG